MKRLCVFSFFDKAGIVGNYVDFLLQDFALNVSLLVIVVNGHVNSDGLKRFKRYTNQIIIRENKGYDAGAYKEVILDHLGSKIVEQYDELILCNDTFYGMFTPLKEIFSIMYQRNVDFWGLNYVNNGLMNYLQSYFLVFSCSILKSGDLFEYLKKWINEKTEEIADVYAFFEVGLFVYLERKGYKFSAYAKENCCDIYKSSNYAIQKYNLPIMKKKCFSPIYHMKVDVLDALRYIDSYFEYDISLILQEAKRTYNILYTIDEIYNSSKQVSIEKFISVALVKRDKLLKFLYENRKIYIYGTGSFARKMFCIYGSDFQYVEGFIVSDNQEISNSILFGYPVYHLSEIDPTGISILIAMNRENRQSVTKYLKNYKTVLCLW